MATRPYKDDAPARAKQAGIDVGAVIESVSHRVTAVARGASLRAVDRLYRADFDRSGVAVSLRATAKSRPAVRVRTVAASLGGQPVALSPGRWRSHANEAARALAPALVERVRAREGRLDWEFVVQRRAGTGALRIAAKLSGAGRRVRVDRLRVRDAAGRDLYRSRPRIAPRRVVLEVPARVLDRARFPLTVAARISPEYPVSEQVFPGPAPSPQQEPALAFDGTNYFLAWQDYRSGTTTDLYGARVTPAGTVLDPAGIVISSAPNHQRRPAVAFDGANFLVAWEDARSGSYAIYGARVSPAGTVLDPNGIPISTGAASRSQAALAFDGTNYLVVWSDNRSGQYDVYGARVSPGGTVLDPNGIAISTASGGQEGPSVAYDGVRYLVAWMDRRSGSSYDVYGARVTTAGTVLEPAGIAISTEADNSFAPRTASGFDGTNFFVAWGDSRGGAYDVYGARVSPAGAVLDPSGIPVSTAPRYQSNPSLAFDGTNYLVLWSDQRLNDSFPNVFGARVSPSGTVLDPAGLQISSGVYEEMPAVAFDGTNYLVAWSDYRGDGDIYDARVSPAGDVLDPTGLLVSGSPANTLKEPALAFDGANYLVVWEDDRLHTGTDTDLYGTRVTLGGTALDPAGIPISTAAGAQRGPAIAFDGTNYLVVWQSSTATCGRTVCGTRVTRQGAVLDPAGIPIVSGGTPAVAFDGTNYLVVSATGGITGARVDQSGVVLDPAGIAIRVHGMYDYQLEPSVAFNGTNYLVAWREETDVLGFGNIGGTRVSPAGQVLDGIIPISYAANQQSYPAVASDGTNYFVTWTDTPFTATSRIRGARVSGAGGVLDSGIPISAERAVEPSVAFDGADYLVAWEDYRSSTAGADVYAARVSPTGSVLDPGGFGVSTNPSASETAVSVAPGPRIPTVHSGAPAERRLAVAYQRNVAEPPYGGVVRVLLRFVDTPP